MSIFFININQHLNTIETLIIFFINVAAGMFRNSSHILLNPCCILSGYSPNHNSTALVKFFRNPSCIYLILVATTPAIMSTRV